MNHGRVPTSEPINWANLLVTALQELPSHFERNELAYLSLTAKVESPVRDGLAWYLHRTLVEERGLPLYVARQGMESGRNQYDLAVYEHSEPTGIHPKLTRSGRRDPSPKFQVEFRFGYGLEFAGPTVSARRVEGFDLGVQKLQGKYFDTEMSDPTTLSVFVVVVVHPLAEVPQHLKKVLRYSQRLTSGAQYRGGVHEVRRIANQNLPEFLNERYGGHVEVVHLERIGEVLGIPVGHDYFLVVGPTKAPPFRIH